MTSIHTPTLLLVLAAISLLAAGALFMERLREPSRPLDLWIGAYLCGAALAVSNLGLFGWSDSLAGFVPPGLGFLALALMYCGLASHLGRNVPAAAFLPVVFWFGAAALRWYGEPLAETYLERRLVMCVLYACYGLSVGLLLLRSERLTRIKKALFVVFILYAAFYLARLTVLTPDPGPSEQALSDFWMTFAIYKSILFVAASAYLFLAIRRERSEFHLREAAEGDPLTGLPNRRTFRLQADRILDRKRGAILCLIDLDHFKAVNDTCGHAVGDKVLCAFAALLRDAARKGDAFARLGGEEFALLLSEETPRGASRRIAALAQAFRDGAPSVAALPLPATFSGGLVAARPNEDLDQMLARADVALYAAKRSGRDRVEINLDRPPIPHFDFAGEAAAS